jgi:hypothetical protein
MGAQHRRYGGDALIDHLPQSVGKGPSAGESVVDLNEGLERRRSEELPAVAL